MKRVLMIAHTGPLFGTVAGQLAKYEIETVTIEKQAINSREEAKKLAEGMGLFDGVIHSVLLDAEEYPDRLFEMEPHEWELWKETVFVKNYWILGAFLPPLEQCGGKYLVVGSAAGITPSKNDEINGAASAAGFMMMKCAATELGRKCRVNGIAAGAMDEYETEGLRGGGMLESTLLEEEPLSRIWRGRLPRRWLRTTLVKTVWRKLQTEAMGAAICANGSGGATIWVKRYFRESRSL